MPIFEYRCSACAHLEEVLQKHSDPPPTVCPACGKEHTLAKELSLTSFQLKGGGWYKDLYASSKPGTESSGGSATTATASAPASTTSTSESSTASAPAASAPAASTPAPAAAKASPAA